MEPCSNSRFGIWMCLFLNYRYNQKQLRKNIYTSQAKTNQIKALQEGIGGIRDVILNNTQKLHQEFFYKIDSPMRIRQAQNSFIAASPKYIIEAIGLILIAIICLLFRDQGDSSKDLIIILGTLALASQRLLPSLQSLYNCWASISGIFRGY